MNKEKFLKYAEAAIKECDSMINAHGVGSFESCTFVVRKNLWLRIKLMIEEGQFDE